MKTEQKRRLKYWWNSEWKILRIKFIEKFQVEKFQVEKK